MTETPKHNPFDFLASFGAPSARSASGEPNIFDILIGPQAAGAGKKGIAAEDVVGLFESLVNGIVPEHAEKREKPEASEKHTPKYDPRPTAYGDISIQIPLVGVPKDNILIEVRADTIVVKATVPDYVDVPASKRTIEKYERLPLNVDVEKITSTLKDGLLTINLPAIKPTKVKIDVSEG